MNEMILKSWHTLNEVLNELREDQVKSLLEYEMEYKCRSDIVWRLHQRFSKLRAVRERKELMCKLEK